MKHRQQDAVYKIVLECQPIRTEQVKIKAMKLGISCADRYLRYLQQEGKIVGVKLPTDRTKTWRTL